MENQVVIYQAADGSVQLEVKFEQETVWLNRQQLSVLFDRDIKTIGKHVTNVFREKELDRQLTVANFATVQMEGNRLIERKIEYYNLDVIISVGYRVKSQKGTQFRQWATQQLKNLIVRGYAVNQKRLEQLQQTLELISSGVKTEKLQLQEAKGLLEIISNYTRSFVLLNQFDSSSIRPEGLSSKLTYEIKYNEAKVAISELKRQLIQKSEATELFGNEKDNGFQSSLQSIVQTFEGQYLYPSIEEQAAHLLYFVIKNQ